MNLAAFTVPAPETASAHTRALIASGALLVPARFLRMNNHNPGSIILCPNCYSSTSLAPTWNSDGKSMIGFHCLCGTVFDNSQALYLIFGHLTP